MYYEEFIKGRNLKKQSTKHYKTATNRYALFHDKKFDELIEEAMSEEDEKIPLRRRQIKARLLSFRTHLIDSGLKSSTVKKYMQCLSTIYKYYDIEMPNLPRLKSKDIIETTYFDLPTAEHIAMALDVAGIKVGSMILFMASNGTAREECANMTVGGFIEACTGYYTKETIPEIIEELYYSKEDIVPTFSMFRKKTEKKYYTFCTPQATRAICEWLLLRFKVCEVNKDNPDEKVEKEVLWESSLWNLDPKQISDQFARINKELKLGYGKDGFTFFRPHNLRKFNGSNIGLSQDNIDLIHGRSKDRVHAAYIKTNPENLRKIYMSVMDNVTIGKAFDKEIIHEDITLNINLNFYGKDYGVAL